MEAGADARAGAGAGAGVPLAGGSGILARETINSSYHV
jgi:hypothetical protein